MMVVWGRVKPGYSCAVHRSPISMKVVRISVAQLRAFFVGILVGLAIIGIVLMMI